MDRQEGRIGGGALLAQRGEHDRLHRLETREHVQERRVEPAGGVVLRRRRELVLEAEAVEEAAQHSVIVVREALVLAERIRNACQRLAEVLPQHVAVRHVVRHLAQPVHVVGEGEEPRRDAAFGQDVERVADHGRARDLAERADVRQARRAIAGLEEHVLLSRPLHTRHELARFLERPCLRLPGGVGKRKRRGGGRRRGRHGRNPVRSARRPSRKAAGKAARTLGGGCAGRQSSRCSTHSMRTVGRPERGLVLAPTGRNPARS